MEIELASQLSTLAHPQRLALFRLLMRRYPDRLPAGEIAALLGAKPNTVSAYLGALLRADLVVQERSGTSLRYAARLDGVRLLLDGLVGECCRGRVDLLSCYPPHSLMENPMSSAAKLRVLFICSGKSARSIMAEALLRQMGNDRFEAHSAGVRPYSELNPFVIDLLQAKGHDITALRAKHVDEYRQADTAPFDFVFTVCDAAANEECPAWPGQTVTAHWGLKDPVKVAGTDAQKAQAFQDTYGILANRLTLFTTLPLESLDRAKRQAEADLIGADRSAQPA